MPTEQQLDRWARALVEDSLLGGPAVSQKYGVTSRTLERWRARLRTDARLRQLYERGMSKVDSEFADALTTRPAVVAVRRSDPRADRAPSRGRHVTTQLADAIAAEIAAVAALAGWPEVKSAERNHALPSGRRLSLLVAHRDGSHTLCEVGPASAHGLGHLLFCFEDVRMHYRVPASSLRLCVLSDGDAPPLWNRVVANVKVEVGFCNIGEVVRARLLASQNVLTPEPAAAACGSMMKEG